MSTQCANLQIFTLEYRWKRAAPGCWGRAVETFPNGSKVAVAMLAYWRCGLVMRTDYAGRRCSTGRCRLQCGPTMLARGTVPAGKCRRPGLTVRQNATRYQVANFPLGSRWLKQFNMNGFSVSTLKLCEQLNKDLVGALGVVGKLLRVFRIARLVERLLLHDANRSLT